MDPFSIAVGAAGVGLAYFLYLASTRGLPAAYAWMKAKWNAGRAGIAQLETGLEGIAGRVTLLEQQVLPALQAAQADISALKDLLPKASATASAAAQAAVSTALMPQPAPANPAPSPAAPVAG